MRSSTKWISAFLLGMMVSPACRQSGEPAKSGPSAVPSAETPTQQPTDQPGVEPDTGAPIGPVANPGYINQYDDGLLGAVPAGGTGALGGSGGSGAIGGLAGSGGAAPRYLVAL